MINGFNRMKFYRHEQYEAAAYFKFQKTKAEIRRTDPEINSGDRWSSDAKKISPIKILASSE